MSTPARVDTTIAVAQVVFTHQKHKKRPAWHDGELVVGTSGTRATLHDEDGKILEVLYKLPPQVGECCCTAALHRTVAVPPHDWPEKAH